MLANKIALKKKDSILLSWGETMGSQIHTSQCNPWCVCEASSPVLSSQRAEQESSKEGRLWSQNARTRSSLHCITAVWPLGKFLFYSSGGSLVKRGEQQSNPIGLKECIKCFSNSVWHTTSTPKSYANIHKKPSLSPELPSLMGSQISLRASWHVLTISFLVPLPALAWNQHICVILGRDCGQ